MLAWLCAIVATALLALGVYAGMKWYGAYALRRDDAERGRLAEEWKRRAAGRKAHHEGAAPPAEDEGAPPIV